MRVLHQILPIALLLSALFAACKKDGSTSPLAAPSAGTWKVVYFFDKQDETSYYAAYSFEFGAKGSLSATNGSQTWSGTWLTGSDDSANKFTIDFSGPVPSALAELEEDWRIIALEDEFMHFEHTSGGNGDTDVLKFKKM
ncbi:MAG TPA: hypothetical protein PK971_09640 [Saprospiraceae bacterium]|nr:hypothetical protein [Saprospiraceae bacterium]HND88581.1 hypothetical protein [Saprospiraceae bacterium]HNG89503.1 hypothetical protein [Saprospiraceae bacterium]